MSAKELVKNTAIIGIAKISVQMIQFFLLPIYTSYLTTSEYGEYDYLTTIGLFLVPIITLLMEEAMFRFLIPAKTNKEKSIVLSNTVFFIGISSIITLSILTFILNLIEYQYTEYLLLYIIGMILYNLSTALARGTGNIKLYSLASFLSAFITIILNVFFIVGLHLGVVGIMIAGSIAHIVISIMIFILSGVYQQLSLSYINKHKLFKMLRYAIPLVPNSISWVIINLSNRIIIVNFLSASANGIYSVANKFPNLINTIYGFFYTAWKESAAKVINADDRDAFYQMIYRQLKRLLFSLCLGLIGFLPLAFPFLINSDFNAAFNYIPILVIGMYFSNISGFYGGIFSAYLDTKIMGKSTMISAVINILLTLIFIKYIGVFAAILGTFISNLIVYIIRARNIKKYIIFDKDNVFNILSIITTFLIIIGYYISDRSLFIKIGIALISCVFAFVANYKVIKSTLFLIKAKG